MTDLGSSISINTNMSMLVVVKGCHEVWKLERSDEALLPSARR